MLRGINAHSTTNNIDRNGLGLERFYAPGRNFAASIEIRFLIIKLFIAKYA